MLEFLKEVPPITFLWGGVVFLFLIAYMVFMGLRVKKQKEGNANYLVQHPDASKIFLTAKGVMTSEATTVHTVNGQAPQSFTEGGRSGFYIVPGVHNIQISFSYTRPGVMYRSVTKSTGVLDERIEVHANRVYQLGFNRKENHFMFDDVTGQA